MSAQDIWNKRKQEEGTLPEDGKYYGDIESCKENITNSNFEIMEFLIRVSEGQYLGEQVKKSIFLFNPNKPENTQGQKELNTLISRWNKDVFDREENYFEAKEAFKLGCIGHRVSFEQKSGSTGGKFLYIHEFFGPQVPPPAMFGPGDAEPNDIPF